MPRQQLLAPVYVCKCSHKIWVSNKKTRLEHEILKLTVAEARPIKNMCSDSCCHLWVCDNAQRVFVIEDIYGLVESIHASLTIADAPAASDLIKWTRVEGSLEKVG